MFQIELVGLIILSVACIGFFFKLKFNIDDLTSKYSELKKKDDAIIIKQEADHAYLIQLQSEKEKALWDEMKTFRDTMLTMIQGLGRVEGKIDSINRRD